MTLPRRLASTSLVVVLAGALAGPSAAEEASRPIRVHPANPRYLQWRGQPTVLVASGEHYGAVLNPDFDYVRYLRATAEAGLNHTRVFLGSYVEWPHAFAIADNTLSPAPGRFLAPWARSTTPGFSLGGNKFDLDRWDEAFLSRLHGFLDEAERRGVVVEAVLFFSGPGWDHMPMNPRNNVNGTDDVGAKRYVTLDNGNVLARQEALARKLVREMNRHGNLIINLCNEPWFDNQDRPGFVAQPPAATKAWIARVAQWVRDEESRLPWKHVVSVDISNQGTLITAEDLSRHFSQVDGFNVHYDANADSLRLNPTLPRYLAFNETGFNGTGDDPYRVQGWNYLLGGGAVYSHLDYSFTVGHEDGSATPAFVAPYYNGGGSPALRAQLEVLLDFMRSIPFAEMRRDDAVVVGGADSWAALAQPGRAWAVWFPGDGPIEPSLALGPGRYHAEWVDILTGAVTTRPIEAEQWITTIPGVRRGGGAALRVFSEGGDARKPSMVASATAAKPRTIVTTDIETDDYNSLIRYLLYANDLETAGLVYGSSEYHWAGDGKGTTFFLPRRPYSTPQTSWRWTGVHRIQELIEDYRTAYPNLQVHDPTYPAPDHLLSLVKMGNIAFEGDVARETEGSNWIKDKLLDDVPGPLFLQAWGGTNTIARALMSIEEQYRDTPQWPAIYRKVSDKAVIYVWGKQDGTYDSTIGVQWPEIQTNDISSNAWGYWTRGASSTNVLEQDEVYFQPEWTRANVLDVGPLGGKYRVWADGRQFAGDHEDTFGLVPYPGHPLPESLPRDHFISEGDTPAFLNLIDTGLRSHEHPSYGGWGNRLTKASTTRNYWTSERANERDETGTVVANYTSKRWVAAAQRDFAARLKWSVTPSFAGANHHPVVSVASGLDRIAAPGETVNLAGAATDPDGNALTYRWWQYREAGTYPGAITFSSATTGASSFVVPADAVPGQTIHAVLEVTDHGTPALTRWQRVIVTVVARGDRIGTADR